jgi:mono/diheme cytochrome c family protein
MIARQFRYCAIALTIALPPASAAQAADPPRAAGAAKAASAQIARGRYLTMVGNCNDCHTREFAERDGNVPESQWLKGSSVGFNGPWGTTYASNLRLTASAMTETEWVTFSKSLKRRPPMPWFSLNRWSDQDLRALYQFIKSLGPAGAPAPAFMPPDTQPSQPFIQWPLPPK